MDGLTGEDNQRSRLAFIFCPVLISSAKIIVRRSKGLNVKYERRFRRDPSNPVLMDTNRMHRPKLPKVALKNSFHENREVPPHTMHKSSNLMNGLQSQ